jgi:hypothetical protein
MTPKTWVQNALTPALRLLPENMDTPAARAMCVAIALQESGLEHRFQIGGPAVSYVMFELAGIRGVMEHKASAPHVLALLEALDYHRASLAQDLYEAMPHNDILSAGMARLLLWTLPDKLPEQTEGNAGYAQYLQAWRPGRPRPDAWPTNFSEGWDLATISGEA